MINKKNIKISIVVPVYNVEEYLEKCIESLINQTYENIEILLINDGSTDKSPEMCDKYKQKDYRIKVVHKINEGLSEARNVGIENSQGDYILFVDSDDYIEIDTCEKFINIIEGDIDIITGNAIKINKDSHDNMIRKDIEDIISGAKYLKVQLKENKMYMAAWLNLYRKNFLVNNNLKFKKGLLHEDEQFTPRAFLRAQKVKSANIVFYNYIIRENSITQKKNLTKNAKHIIDTCYELEKIYNRLEDKELRDLLLDNLVSKYLYAFQMVSMQKNKKEIIPKKKFVIRNAHSRRNIVKAIIFTLNTNIYFYINRITKVSIS